MELQQTFLLHLKQKINKVVNMAIIRIPPVVREQSIVSNRKKKLFAIHILLINTSLSPSPSSTS